MPTTRDAEQCRGLAQGARFRRRFGYPGRLDAEERVWLKVDEGMASSTISLNGRQLHLAPSDGAFESDVTARLQERNELLVEMNTLPEQDVFGEVALEIRRTAFLRRARAEWLPEENVLRVSGEVVGTASRALDLYVLVGRHTVAQSLVEATYSGATFELRSEVGLPKECPELARIELVDASTVWYTLEVKLQPRDNPDDQSCSA